ncbi:nuclear transport factor 2 family protein [Acidocella sp.]|uniref:nuclear transport factor 2 family protein n=1 Tax=Acidocella sp. TaxID=50710 RepID=UPI00260E1E32|nr:nuclear transport factor 2 family protein [Acidocella sp.]
MTDSDDGLQALLDERGIRKCIEGLARGEDRRDAAMISAAYWPDSVTDYGVFKGDFAAYLAWVVPGSPAIPCTQHVLGQSFIQLEGGTAKVETQVISYHRVDFGTAHHDTVVGGRYLDVLEKRGGKWAIASRTMLYDWYHDFGVANDFSAGVMGLPFSAEYFSGRAHGDFSETFFARG